MTHAFVRDSYAWLAYIALGYFAYMQATLGPAMTFISDELGLNYTVSGLHLSLFALGMVVSGLFADTLAERWGRRLVFWAGGIGMGLGGIFLTTGQSAVATIFASWLMGFAGSWLIVIIQATLSDKYGHQRATALTESNITASFLALFAPLMVGLGQAIGLGWETALFAGIMLFALLILRWNNLSIPQPTSANHSNEHADADLPRQFSVFLIIIFLGVSIEWCVIFWGASFLEDVIGLSEVVASSTMTIFFIAMVIGRFVGSRLTRRYASDYLVLGAIVLVILGFPLFWLAEHVWLNVLGLFVAGLGIANLFPLTLSSASNLAPNLADRASARILLSAGLAILVTPQVLGTVADSIGLFNAYGIVAIFSVIIVILLVMTLRMSMSFKKDFR